MNRSSRLKNILNKRSDLWIDSETDSSSISDVENVKTSLINCETSSDENNEPSRENCCLICSVLPNLSTINTCSKHLTLLTRSKSSPKIVYMMPPPKIHCPCRSKRRCRSSSSSSSESKHRRKRRARTVQSSNSSSENDLFYSPNIQSQAIMNDNHVQPRLSPSLPPSSTNINQNLQQYNELLFTPFLNNQPSDVIELDSDSSCSPSISPDRIVHVKDDDEILNDNDQKNLMINMAQATEQMLDNQYPQPIILLQRVCFER